MAKLTQAAVQNKDVAALVERFKTGYTLMKSGSGHFHVVGPNGEVRNEKGQPISIPGTPKAGGPHALKRLKADLEKVGVLDTNGKPTRERTPDEELRSRTAGNYSAVTEQQEQVKEFRKKSEPWIKRLGGWDQRGLVTDLALIAHNLEPALPLDSLAAAVSKVKSGDAPGTANLAALWKVHDQMMEAEDPREFYFDTIRELRGFTPVTVAPGAEWPFVVELVKLDDMIVDETYQRPVHDVFTRDLVLKFDERLVGTIDLSKRKQGQYAILDGLQRYTTMGQVGKTAAWAAVYAGMTVEDEAAFFYHKNRDRKMIHPYYHFRARLVAGDSGTQEINRIVEKHGFRLYTSSGSGTDIAAIAAVERVYAFSSPFREECLTPALSLIKRLWSGRKASTDGELIRGLGRFFQVYDDPEINYKHLDEILAELGPGLVIGRAKDNVAHLTGGRGGSSGGFGIGRTIAEIHNTGLTRPERLDIRRLSSNPSVRANALALAPGVRE